MGWPTNHGWSWSSNLRWDDFLARVSATHPICLDKTLLWTLLKLGFTVFLGRCAYRALTTSDEPDELNYPRNRIDPNSPLKGENKLITEGTKRNISSSRSFEGSRSCKPDRTATSPLGTPRRRSANVHDVRDRPELGPEIGSESGKGDGWGVQSLSFDKLLHEVASLAGGKRTCNPIGPNSISLQHNIFPGIGSKTIERDAVNKTNGHSNRLSGNDGSDIDAFSTANAKQALNNHCHSRRSTLRRRSHGPDSNVVFNTISNTVVANAQNPWIELDTSGAGNGGGFQAAISDDFESPSRPVEYGSPNCLRIKARQNTVIENNKVNMTNPTRAIVTVKAPTPVENHHSIEPSVSVVAGGEEDQVFFDLLNAYIRLGTR